MCVCGRRCDSPVIGKTGEPSIHLIQRTGRTMWERQNDKNEENGAFVRHAKIEMAICAPVMFSCILFCLVTRIDELIQKTEQRKIQQNEIMCFKLGEIMCFKLSVHQMIILIIYLKMLYFSILAILDLSAMAENGGI